MLRMIRSMRELDFRALTDVYCDNEEILGHHDQSPERRLDAEQDFYRYLKEVFFRTSEACYAVWERDGRYLAALRLEPYQDGLLIEGLETRPDMRNRGFAKKLLFSVRASAGETPLYSHVAKKNLASVRTHLSCGFDRLLEYAIYADGSVLQNCCTFCYRHRSERKDLR